MGWLFLLVALLCLAFPPFAVVILAMLILGVFVKGMGMTAESQEQIVSTRRKTRHRHAAERPHDVMRHYVMEPQEGQVIDVHSYPIPPLALLPPPRPKSLDGSP
jgi:hypothetical protein